jgi:putative peptide zinc metalloprotease protein
VAVFVWAFTGPSLLNSLAYNVIFLAGAVTVLFNINPLMRYDGYYILSDLTEIPNLRARSTRYVLDMLRRVVFGVRPTPPPAGRRLRVILLTFGLCAAVYRAALMLAIAAILASKMFVVGLMLAVVYLGGTAAKLLLKLTQYLWYAEETAARRGRAVALSLLTLIIIPIGLFVVPIPSHVHAKGLLVTEHETLMRARTPGFVEQVPIEHGQQVRRHDLLARLHNDAYLEDIATTSANLRASRIRTDAYRIDDPARARQEQVQARVHQRALLHAHKKLEELEVRAPAAGRIVDCLETTDAGRYVPEGDPIAMIVSGAWQIRTILSEEQIAATRPQPGDKVQFRAAAAVSRTIEGRIEKVSPAGSKTVRDLALTHLGGGDIAVDPSTHAAAEPYFEITINLQDAAVPELQYGMTGSVRLPAVAEPVGVTVTRRLVRFVNKLLQE